MAHGKLVFKILRRDKVLELQYVDIIGFHGSQSYWLSVEPHRVARSAALKIKKPQAVSPAALVGSKNGYGTNLRRDLQQE
jgi:hypothetical protein